MTRLNFTRLSALLHFATSMNTSSFGVLLARYLKNQWTKFHQTLVIGVFKAKDALIRFWRSQQSQLWQIWDL